MTVYRKSKNDQRKTTNEHRKSNIENRPTNNDQRTTTNEQRPTNMHSNLEVWKLSHQLTLEVYKISNSFPKSEQFGLVSQVRRSASSVPTNIVEGQARQYKKEFTQFLFIAKASLEETNYHLYLAKDLGYLTEIEYRTLEEMCTRIKMMLFKLIKSMQ